MCTSVILGWVMDILPGTYHNKGLDPGAVPTNLSCASLPNTLLLLVWRCASVWYLGCFQQHLHLQSGILLLERLHPRALHKSRVTLVYKCWRKHRSGSPHSPTTNASHPDTQNIQKPEAGLNHNDCAWCKVKYLSRGTVHKLTMHSVSLVSIIRLYTLDDVANTDDLSYDNPAHATLSALEVNAGIICACLPAMRPLLSLTMPKYFSDVAQYTEVAIMLDIEHSPYHKHVRTSSDVVRYNMTLVNTNGSVGSPTSPRPTLSRTPSGRFAVIHSHPGRTGFISHSRSGSNVSIDIAAADARANGPRFQGRINPLRLSPITPTSPFNSRVLYPIDTNVMSSRNTSGTSSPVVWRPQTPVSVKPLPLTPLPVGGGG
jgi:hypothetical protein